MTLAGLCTQAARKPALVAVTAVTLYVLAATAAVLCSSPPYYSFWVLPTLLLTLPVSVFGFGIAFAGGVTEQTVPLIIGAHVVVGALYALPASVLLRGWARRTQAEHGGGAV